MVNTKAENFTADVKILKFKKKKLTKCGVLFSKETGDRPYEGYRV
jgi:hypothetical protein